MREIIYKPIGIVHSPFKKKEGVPIQPLAGKGTEGKLIIFPEYAEGLTDLEGFSHIFLIYYFHLSKGYTLKVKPFLDNKIRGVFATRAPRRPNQIGISVVRLTRVEENMLHIMDIDIVDETPLLDIKPYVSEFDTRDVEKTGWLAGKEKEGFLKRSDDRFKS
jgi:tRNA-Thr(GGU) m(6)t(6)A37 methyltransferase TsaA